MVKSPVSDGPVVWAVCRTTTRITGTVVVVDVGGKVVVVVTVVKVVKVVKVGPALLAVTWCPTEDEVACPARADGGAVVPALGLEGNTGPDALATALS
jgi:hypothetical protein